MLYILILYIKKKLLLALENYNPLRNCTINQHECKNSYGYRICVDKKLKHVACAKYSKNLCNEDKFFSEYVSDDGEIYKRFNFKLFLVFC